jgi:hypothetical protein
MSGWIATIMVLFTHPKQLMLLLPSNRICSLAILSPLYLNMARAFNPRNYGFLSKWLGGDLYIILFVCCLSAFTIPFSGWLIQQILKLFHKRLSILKILNINGFAQFPRLLVGLFSSLILQVNPSFFKDNRPSVGLIAMILLGLAAMGYNLFLVIYGYVVSPSEDQQDD